MSKKYLILGLVIIIVAVFYLVRQNYQSLEQTSPQNKFNNQKIGVITGKLAPDFSLTTVTGKTVKLSDFQGKYVLIGFMATWCVPCQIEAENVKKVQEKKNFVVMQIGIDQRETKEDLLNFQKKFGRDDWLMGFDQNFQIAKLYKVRSFDTTLVINPEGKIIYRDDGWPIDIKTLQDLFESKND